MIEWTEERLHIFDPFHPSADLTIQCLYNKVIVPAFARSCSVHYYVDIDIWNMFVSKSKKFHLLTSYLCNNFEIIMNTDFDTNISHSVQMSVLPYSNFRY
jgi:hypothetical protein